MKLALTRRELFWRYGPAISLLPFLGHFDGSKASGATGAIKRFIYIHTPNGTLQQEWKPKGTESAFELGAILAPLKPFQSDIVVTSGIDMNRAYRNNGGDVHVGGLANVLTNAGMDEKKIDGRVEPGFALGPSIDQMIASTNRGAGGLASLSLGLMTSNDSNPLTRFSYASGGKPVSPQAETTKAFDSVFPNTFMLNDMQRVAVAQRKKSVLDFSLTQMEDLSRFVGSADKAILEQNAQSIRDLEKSLEADRGSAPVCTLPPRDAFKDVASFSAPERLKHHIDLIAASFACDRTRVATIQVGGYIDWMSFPWLKVLDDKGMEIPVSQEHHALTHMNTDDALVRRKLMAIHVWYASQIAYLIECLTKTRDASGPLIESTLVLWGSETGNAARHETASIPFLLAGRCGGALKTGRFLAYDAGTEHGQLLLSIANAFDLNLKVVGDPTTCSGPLPKLFVA